MDIFLKVVKHEKPKEKDAKFYSLLHAQNANSAEKDYKNIFSKQVSQLKSVNPPLAKLASSVAAEAPIAANPPAEDL